MRCWCGPGVVSGPVLRPDNTPSAAGDPLLHMAARSLARIGESALIAPRDRSLRHSTHPDPRNQQTLQVRRSYDVDQAEALVEVRLILVVELVVV
jgi:hypothetical protein